MLKIGDRYFKERIVGAPLAGVTDIAFRKVIRDIYKGLVCAEMVSSQSLVRCKSKLPYAKQIVSECEPASFQILGRRCDLMAESAKILQELGAKQLDINMGCSVRKVLRQGEGASLLAEPELAIEIMKSVVNAVDIPVTVKIRKGIDKTSEGALKIAQNAQDCGIKAIAIHGRTAEQMYSGESDWEFITKIKNMISIPVIGNGDIRTPIEAVEKLNNSGCDGVMIGRGILGNPWILKESDLLDRNIPFTPVTSEEKFKIANRHFDYEIEIDGEDSGFKKIRKHLSWYIKGMPMASVMRDIIFRTRKVKELKEKFAFYSEFVKEFEIEYAKEKLSLFNIEQLFNKHLLIN